MQLKIKKENLLTLLKKIYGGISKNISKKNIIYSNVLIKITKNKIFCISSDTEIEIVAYEYTNILDEIEMIIPFKKILDICKIATKNSIINIFTSAKNNKIEVSTNNNKISFQKTNEIYPLTIRKKITENQFNLNSTLVKNIFKKAIIAIGDNDSRIYLNGLLTEIHKKNLYIYSCDSYRISSINIELDKEYSETRIIIPKKIIKEIIDIFPENKTINLCYSSKYIRFSTQNISITSKLINSDYPNIKEIFNKKGEKRIYINKNILKQAILCTNIIKNDKNKKNRIILNKNNMTIFASNNIEETITKIKINYCFENMEIGVNFKYIMDIINVIDSQDIYIIFSDPTKPIFIEENINTIYIVMPLNI